MIKVNAQINKMPRISEAKLLKRAEQNVPIDQQKHRSMTIYKFSTVPKPWQFNH